MTDADPRASFDPRTILAAFQRADATFVVIGGLARVLRGSDEVTWTVDICPSLIDANRARVQAALDELEAELVQARKGSRAKKDPGQQPVLRFSTDAGAVNVVPAPAGVPRGYEALRTGATVEHLGGGLRPSVACTADLVTMAAASGRREDATLVPRLQRILQLEASPAKIIDAPTPAPGLPQPAVEAPELEP